jgi:hypothetical protein
MTDSAHEKPADKTSAKPRGTERRRSERRDVVDRRGGLEIGRASGRERVL